MLTGAEVRHSEVSTALGVPWYLVWASGRPAVAPIDLVLSISPLPKVIWPIQSLPEMSHALSPQAARFLTGVGLVSDMPLPIGELRVFLSGIEIDDHAPKFDTGQFDDSSARILVISVGCFKLGLKVDAVKGPFSSARKPEIVIDHNEAAPRWSRMDNNEGQPIPVMLGPLISAFVAAELDSVFQSTSAS